MALKGTKALQSWCIKVTAGYPNVKIENMTKSWRDGLAFCAIIHHYRPELIDFNSLSKKNVRENCTLAFEVAERELGIPALLDPEDMVSMASPDKLSILTYLSQYYNFFKDKKSGGPPPLPRIIENDEDPSGKDVEVSDKGKEIRRRSFKKAKEKEKEKENKAALSGPLPAKISLKSDKCEICGKRVFLVERQVVDGRLFHRNCFRCTKCKSTLRPDSYKLTKDPKKFECMCHSDNGDIWNLRMKPTNRAGARLAGVPEDGGTIWQSRTPKASPQRPTQPPPKQPTDVKPAAPAEPATAKFTPVMPPVVGQSRPPFAGAVPMHPHLMKNAARARFHPSGSPMGSPQLERHAFNGSATSLATQKDMAASQETLDKTPEDSPARPVPLPRVVTKPQTNGDIPRAGVAQESTEKSTTESSSEDTREKENGESSLFSTDDESKFSDAKSVQEGDSLGFASSDLDNINETFRDTDDTTSAEETTAKAEPSAKVTGEDSVSKDELKAEETAELSVDVSVDQNKDVQEDISIANKEKEEEEMNKVNDTLNKEPEKTDLVIGTSDVTNKSVEEGSTGDSALWDTKAELSDSFHDENNESKKSEDATIVTSETTVDKDSEKLPLSNESEQDKNDAVNKDSEKSNVQENETRVEGPSVKKSKDPTDDYDESLNPFGSEDDLEIQKPSKRQSTNPFDTDEDDDGYDNSLNPFGDVDDEDEGNETHASEGSVNPFTGSPIEETPISLRLKGEIRAASFSHPKRPERPPPPILSSGSYSVKTRSEILEELKRDRETLKKKQRAPLPPAGGSPGSVQAPPRARKSRKAPQPPQEPPQKAVSDGEIPSLPPKTKEGESMPTPVPRTAQVVNGTKEEPVPSPRMKKVQKLGQKLPIAGAPLKQVDLKNVELKKVKKPPADFRNVELKQGRKSEEVDDRDRDGDDEMEEDAIWKKVRKDFDFLKENDSETKQGKESEKEMKSISTMVTDNEIVRDLSAKSKVQEEKLEKASISVDKDDKAKDPAKNADKKDQSENTSIVSGEKEAKPKTRRYIKRDEYRPEDDIENPEQSIPNKPEDKKVEQSLPNKNEDKEVGPIVEGKKDREESKPKDLSLNIVPLKPKKKEEIDLTESKSESKSESKLPSGPKIGSIVQSSAETDDLEDIMKNVMQFLNLDFELEKKAIEDAKLAELEEKAEMARSAGKLEMKKEKSDSLSRSKESKPLLSDGEEDDDAGPKRKMRSVRRSVILSDDEPPPVPAPRKKRYHRRHSRRTDSTVSGISIMDDKPERPKYGPPPRAHSQGKRKAPAPPAIKREVGKDHIEVSLIQQELIDIESRQRELEQRGVELEMKLRQDTDDDAAHDDNLLAEWFDVVNQKNQLVRREGELIAQAQQQELELQHAEIEFELRVILQKQEHERIDADAQREEQLLEMLMEVVQKRNQIVERLEEDRLREEAEDRDIEAMMGTGNSKKDKKHKKKHKLGLIK